MLRLRSLRAITLAFLVAISLATAATGFAVYHALIRSIDREVDRRLDIEADQLLSGAADLATLTKRIADSRSSRDSGDIGIELNDRAGRHLAGNMTLGRRLPMGLSALDERARIEGFTRGRALVHPAPDGARLTLAIESEPIDNHDGQRLLILYTGFGVILLLVAGGTLCISLLIRRRIEAVRRAAEAIVDGDMRARVPANPAGGSFDQQAVAFNHMLDRISDLMGSLVAISNDVAHDLRTPLARLHGKLIALAARADSDTLRAELRDAVAESEDMLAMFAAILRITEVEGGDRRAMFAPVDLTTLVEETTASLEPMVEDSGRRLLFTHGPTQPRIEGDARLLVQLLVNLVENAVSHTPAGTTITIGLDATGADARTAAVLTVSDDGPGIAEKDRPLALRRFGRLEQSRHYPGHGLGLPLVQAIAHLHRGRMELEDAGPGLRVIVTLPA